MKNTVPDSSESTPAELNKKIFLFGLLTVAIVLTAALRKIWHKQREKREISDKIREIQILRTELAADTERAESENAQLRPIAEDQERRNRQLREINAHLRKKQENKETTHPIKFFRNTDTARTNLLGADHVAKQENDSPDNLASIHETSEDYINLLGTPEEQINIAQNYLARTEEQAQETNIMLEGALSGAEAGQQEQDKIIAQYEYLLMTRY